MLLDAVDEMGIDASIALANLARQLRGWVGGAHIILTCRSNVWDSGKNALENFTTYRNLSLSNGYNGSPISVTSLLAILLLIQQFLILIGMKQFYSGLGGEILP